MAVRNGAHSFFLYFVTMDLSIHWRSVSCLAMLFDVERALLVSGQPCDEFPVTEFFKWTDESVKFLEYFSDSSIREYLFMDFFQ